MSFEVLDELSIGLFHPAFLHKYKFYKKKPVTADSRMIPIYSAPN